MYLLGMEPHYGRTLIENQVYSIPKKTIHLVLGALIFCQILAIFEDFSKMKHIEGDIEKYIETCQTSYQKNAEKHGGKAFLKNPFLKSKPLFLVILNSNFGYLFHY